MCNRGFVIYDTGETVWYGADNEPGDHTIPDDADMDGFVIARLTIKRKRSWWRLGRKVWRGVSADVSKENNND